MSFEQTIRKWTALNMINVSETVDHIVEMAGERLDGKDKEKVDEVKRLILPFLPPIHKDYRLRNESFLFNAKWMPGEECDESGSKIKTIHFNQPALLRRGASIWVLMDSLFDSAAEARIAMVVVLTPWDGIIGDNCYYYRVEVKKNIPIEQLCLYFKAQKKTNVQVDLYRTPSDVLLSGVGFSKNNTVFSAYFIRQNGSEREDRWYKQVDGTWYGRFRSANEPGWYWNLLEVLRQNQVERIR